MRKLLTRTHMGRWAIFAGVLTIAGSLAVIAARAGQSDQRPAGLSNTGRVVADLSPTQLRDLRMSGIRSEVRLLGERVGHRFYISETAGGQPCFLLSKVDYSPQEFGVLACQGPEGPTFPSKDYPVADFSSFFKAPGPVLPHVTRLSGFAADGVVNVAVVDEQGNSHAVRVTDNLYISLSMARFPATAIVAYDANGAEVYRKPVVPGS